MPDAAQTEEKTALCNIAGKFRLPAQSGCRRVLMLLKNGFLGVVRGGEQRLVLRADPVMEVSPNTLSSHQPDPPNLKEDHGGSFFDPDRRPTFQHGL